MMIGKWDEFISMLVKCSNEGQLLLGTLSMPIELNLKMEIKIYLELRAAQEYHSSIGISDIFL